jgi:DNA-binding CsgD family transcriptional regulator
MPCGSACVCAPSAQPISARAAERTGAGVAKVKADKPTLKPREEAIIKMVAAGINMGDLARKASRHRLFRDLDDAPRQVRRIVDKLEKSGDLGTRLEPRERGGSERYIWPESKTQKKTPLLRILKMSGAKRLFL